MEVDSEIALQPPFEKPIRLEKEYPLSMEEDDANQTYLSCSFVVGTTLDQELYQAFEVLDYALLNSPGAPLRKALLDKGVGKDILGSYDNGTQQPFFSIVAKGANPEDEKVFVETIRQVLEEQVKNGIDRHALKAGVNAAQFRFRERGLRKLPQGTDPGTAVYGQLALRCRTALFAPSRHRGAGSAEREDFHRLF